MEQPLRSNFSLCLPLSCQLLSRKVQLFSICSKCLLALTSYVYKRRPHLHSVPARTTPGPVSPLPPEAGSQMPPKVPMGHFWESPEMCLLHSLSPASPRTQHVLQPLLRHPWPTKPPEEAPQCLGRQSPPQDSHVLATAASRVLQGLETCSSRGAAQIWGEQPPSQS